jgi:hypothetical protein
MSLEYQVKEEESDILIQEYQDKNALKLLSIARTTLRDGSNMFIFKSNLVKKIQLLGNRYSTKLDMEDETQQMILDTWIDEILKFIVLKSILNDVFEPFQLLPGYIVGEGWKCLMLCASVYSKVCIAMGNRSVFDHNPEDTSEKRLEDHHNIKRYNFTLRCYSKYFEQQPSSFYWNFHERKDYNDEDDIISSFGKLCGLDTFFLSSPFHPNKGGATSTRKTGVVVLSNE